MSPEQLKGEEVDSRSDIFSFGIILYEMLAGVHPFIKPDVMATASSILQEESPPLALHREGVSPVIQYIVRKMLAKEAEKRYQSVREIHTDLMTLLQDPDPEAILAGQIQIRRPARWQSLLPWAVVAVVALLAFLRPWESLPEPQLPRRLEVSIGADASLDTSAFPGTAALLSPDGSLLAFVARSGGGQHQLYIRRLDQLQATPLSGMAGHEYVNGPALFGSPRFACVENNRLQNRKNICEVQGVRRHPQGGETVPGGVPSCQPGSPPWRQAALVQVVVLSTAWNPEIPHNSPQRTHDHFS